jgi:hypothetical protein
VILVTINGSVASADNLMAISKMETSMLKALYYPHSDIASPIVLKNALLLWDSIETIVPHAGWAREKGRRGTGPPGRSPAPQSKIFREALELVVSPRTPSDGERREAHKSLVEMTESGFLSALVQQSPGHWRRDDYLIYPEKFLHQTWKMLRDGGMARWVASEHDFGVPAAVGFLMMSILADVCAGTQIRKVTDRNDAYGWLADMHAKALGSQRVTGLDASEVAPAHDRLVALSLEVLDGRQIPFRKLVELRKRELRKCGTEYSAMRRRYLNALNTHIARIGKEAKSESDLRELNRQFKEELKQDVADLKAELGVASSKTLFSKEVAVSALILAGSLISPIAGLTLLAGQVGGVGVIPLMKAAIEYRAARRDVLRKHTMSWLFIGKQGRLTMR